jgi:hypothetical protein
MLEQLEHILKDTCTTIAVISNSTRYSDWLRADWYGKELWLLHIVKTGSGETQPPI